LFVSIIYHPIEEMLLANVVFQFIWEQKRGKGSLHSNKVIYIGTGVRQAVCPGVKVIQKNMSLK
jgi:hypothetical protein